MSNKHEHRSKMGVADRILLASRGADPWEGLANAVVVTVVDDMVDLLRGKIRPYTITRDDGEKIRVDLDSIKKFSNLIGGKRFARVMRR